MNFNRYLLLTFLITFSGLNVSNAATIYKWVDENGKVHYSDKPPKDSKDSQTLDIKESSKNNESQTVLTPQQRINAANKWIKSTRDREAQVKAEKAKKAAEEKKQQQLCQQLKKENQLYRRSNALIDKNEKGEDYVMNEEQRQQVFSEMEQAIKAVCKEK